MYTRVTVFLIIYNIWLSVCVTVLRDSPSLLSETKIDLEPLLITAGLDDIIIISAPIIDNNTLYYLHPPNGDQINLNINIKNLNYSNGIRDEEYINVRYLKGELKTIISAVDRYRIFNVNYGIGLWDTYAENTKDMMPNDFCIGPLQEEDHGNWVLSMYVKNKKWIELFQVISIEIIESIPTTPSKPILSPGETLELSFAYPIQNLESCELRAPKSTFDRFYDRSKGNLNTCGFVITNLTKADQGLWRITAVGRIVYEATVFLEIKDKIT